VSSDERLRRGPAHSKKARAAAAAAAAAAALSTMTGGHGDTMVLAGRPRNDGAQDEELGQCAESAGHGHFHTVGQPPGVGSDSLHGSRTTSGMGTPAHWQVTGGDARNEVAAWDSRASELGSALNILGPSRVGGGVDAGESKMGCGSHDIPPNLSGRAPPWIGICPAHRPADPPVLPARFANLHTEPPVGRGFDFVRGGDHSFHGGDSCAGPSPATRPHALAGQWAASGPQLRHWPSPGGEPTSQMALVGQRPPSVQSYPAAAAGVSSLQAQGGAEPAPPKDLLPSLSSTESTAAPAGVGSLAAATRYCI
jgi:hypothetical protein